MDRKNRKHARASEVTDRVKRASASVASTVERNITDMILGAIADRNPRPPHGRARARSRSRSRYEGVQPKSRPVKPPSSSSSEDMGRWGRVRNVVNPPFQECPPPSKCDSEVRKPCARGSVADAIRGCAPSRRRSENDDAMRSCNVKNERDDEPDWGDADEDAS